MSRRRFGGFCWLGLHERIGGSLPLCMLLLASTCSAMPITLLNPTHSADTSIFGSSTFGGWEITERLPGGSPRDNVNSTEAYLQVGGASSLQIGNFAQSIEATASVEYSIPGVYVSAVLLYGWAVGDGGTSELMSISEPCSANVAGNWGVSEKVCVPNGAPNRLSANLSMHADSGLSGSSSAGPLLVTLHLTPLSHMPEPATMLLVGAVLAGLWRLRGASGS